MHRIQFKITLHLKNQKNPTSKGKKINSHQCQDDTKVLNKICTNRIKAELKRKIKSTVSTTTKQRISQECKTGLKYENKSALSTT